MGILRLLLAVSVIAAHAGPILGTMMVPGNYAVETFFMISGFYMSLILNSKYVGKGAISLTDHQASVRVN
jgi:peptidoglycan/LPS O-acetylase OafA/YrhL